MYNICSVLALFFSLFFLSFYCLKKKKELNQHLPHLKAAPFQPQLNLSSNWRKKKHKYGVLDKHQENTELKPHPVLVGYPGFQ